MQKPWIVPLALLCLALPARSAGYQPGKLLCSFRDKDIRESSGLASSSRSDRYFFTHNDSGDKARFFAVNRKGRTLATFRIPGASNQDWEDMARSRDAAGRSVLFLGDTGDNGAARSAIRIYRVPEPKVDPDRPGQSGSTETAEAFKLQYPDGPKDAETLLADPAGRVYLVSKNPAGSAVYAAPHPLAAGQVNRLKRIGTIAFVLLPGPGGGLREQARRLLATGGAISPDGRRLVVRTYADAYEWDLPRGDVAAGLRGKPRRVPLPAMRQGEAITYTRDSKSLLTSSEGESGPVYELGPQP